MWSKKDRSKTSRRKPRQKWLTWHFFLSHMLLLPWRFWLERLYSSPFIVRPGTVRFFNGSSLNPLYYSAQLKIKRRHVMRYQKKTAAQLSDMNGKCKKTLILHCSVTFNINRKNMRSLLWETLYGLLVYALLDAK